MLRWGRYRTLFFCFVLLYSTDNTCAHVCNHNIFSLELFWIFHIWFINVFRNWVHFWWHLLFIYLFLLSSPSKTIFSIFLWQRGFDSDHCIGLNTIWRNFSKEKCSQKSWSTKVVNLEFFILLWEIVEIVDFSYTISAT